MGENLTVATIQRRVASLSSIFNLTKSTNPAKEPVVILTIKRLRRNFGKPQKQATPLTYDILIKLKNICSDDIVGLRNKLLLQLGYETMRRRSEICQFRFKDLQHHGNHKHALLLKHSKTDQYNQGKIIPISGELSEMILSWSLTIDQDSGYILRSFKRNLSTNLSLTPASINHILKNLQKKAGLNQIGELSGHSFRVGAALDLLDKNIPLEKIMLRGGWKSETSAMRYLQSWNDQNWTLI
jgi:integrase